MSPIISKKVMKKKLVMREIRITAPNSGYRDVKLKYFDELELKPISISFLGLY